MIKFMKICAIVLVQVIASTATAQEKHEESYTVSRGETIRLWGWAHFDKDCKTNGMAQYTFDRNPKLGKVIIRKEKFEVTRSAYEKCVGKTYPGMRIYYTASPDGAGTDKFTIFQNKGTERERHIKVTVNIK
jgi:hypothetical protein